MADRPILFSAPMVRALLHGRKTQTRRVFIPPKPFDPSDDISVEIATGSIKPKYSVGDRLWVREAWHAARSLDRTPPRDISADWDIEFAATKRSYAVIGLVGKLRPSMFMPRWASRLTLIVEGVKVERLQDISAVDALAEGVEWESADPPFCYVPGIFPHSRTAIGIEEAGSLPHEARSYAKLWGEINGPESWHANPWVVALTFRVIKANIDSAEAAA